MEKSFGELLDEMCSAQTASMDDAEIGHVNADGVLIEVAAHTSLTKEQREILIKEYNQVQKWYS